MDILMVCLLYSLAVAVGDKFPFYFRSWQIETHSSSPRLFIPREQKSSAPSLNALTWSRLLLVRPPRSTDVGPVWDRSTPLPCKTNQEHGRALWGSDRHSPSSR